MRKTMKGLVIAAMAGLLVFGFGSGATADEDTGGLDGAAIGHMGSDDPGPCVDDVLDLPALNICETADGTVRMDLPAMSLWGPSPAVDEPEVAPAPAEVPAEPRRLPVTGVNVADIFAMGLAALSAGGVLVRRVRMTLGA